MKRANWSLLDETAVYPGIFRQVFTAGNLQIVRYRYAPGSVFETHAHPEEQLTVGLQGRLEFEVAGQKHTCGPGDVVFVPGGVSHDARNVGDGEAVTLNFFSPPKEGF